MSALSRLKRKAGETSATPAKRSKNAHAPTIVNGTDSSSDAPSQIEKLSDELLLLIIAHLKSSTLGYAPSVFLALCLTNRRFNGLANDYLYENVIVSSVRPPGKLLRTIIADPELARRIKKLTWHFQKPSSYIKTDVVPGSRERRNLRESLKRLGVADRILLERQYVEGHSGEMLQITLLHTPNLRNLVVWEDGGLPDQWLPRHDAYLKTLGNAASGKSSVLVPAYPHLQSIYFDMDEIQLDLILPILRFSSLRTLHLSGICPSSLQLDNPLFYGLRDQSSVTELVIMDSYCDADILSHLIMACRRLETFVLQCEYEWKPDPGFSAITNTWYPTLIRALRKHENTLETLILDDDTDRGDEDLGPSPRGLLGDVKSFSKLRDFSVPLEAFKHLHCNFSDWDSTNSWDADVFARLSDVLPPSLEYLTLAVFLRDPIDSYVATLSLLAKSIPTHFPRLKSVGIRAMNSMCIDRGHLEALRPHFACRGVDFWDYGDEPDEPSLPEDNLWDDFSPLIPEESLQSGINSYWDWY